MGEVRRPSIDICFDGNSPKPATTDGLWFDHETVTGLLAVCGVTDAAVLLNS